METKLTELQSKLEHAEKCCAEMRGVLLACDTYLAGASQPTNRALIKRALSDDCGKDYVSRRDVRELLHKYGRHHRQCAMRTDNPCSCGLDAALNEDA